jgi:hypothetical protein
MIKGFEKETHELTEQELKLVGLMVQGLKTKIGKINAITNKKMENALVDVGYKVNPSRIRKLIHHIRVKKLVPNLISTNKGYYIATSEEEIFDYIESLQQRINSIEEIKNSFNI